MMLRLRSHLLILGFLVTTCVACGSGSGKSSAPATSGTAVRATTSTTSAPGLLPTASGHLSLPPAGVTSLDLPGFDATIDLNTCQFTATATNDTIGFTQDSAEISNDGRAALATLAAELKGAQAVFVVGHTSTEGDANYNQGLSERRAEAVANVLAPLVAGATFNVHGAGETEPVVVPDDTESARAQNRRVVISGQIQSPACRSSASGR